MDGRVSGQVSALAELGERLHAYPIHTTVADHLSPGYSKRGESMARANKADPEETSHCAAPTSAPQDAPIGILLVTSQKILETGLLALLDGVPGFRVVGAASSGLEALSLIAKLRPSAVIADECLPDMSATELIRRIATDSAKPKVLSLSSSESWVVAIGMFRAGASGYMSKQRSFECMKEALWTITRGMHFVDGETGGQMAHALSERRPDTPEVALSSLSTRENEVFMLLVEGQNPHEISKSLFISRKTVETHRRTIYRKLKVRDLAELMKFAVRHHLIKP
jgi:DNA-binding NarL/FixJ family response regulator